MSILCSCAKCGSVTGCSFDLTNRECKTCEFFVVCGFRSNPDDFNPKDKVQYENCGIHLASNLQQLQGAMLHSVN